MYIHNIDPEFLKLGPITIRYYGLLFGTGIFAAYFIARKFFRLKNHPDAMLDKLLIYLIIGLVLGAHFVHLAFYEPKAFIDNPIRIIQVGSGLASHGGFLGAIIGLYLFSRKHKINFWEYADVLAVGGSIVGIFIRLGNFFNSEIYGRATDLPLGVVFQRRGETLPRHPSQLYEMAIGIVIFLILYFFYKKYYTRVKDGMMLYSFVILYFTTRFFIEYVKEYQVLNSSFPFTMGQLLSAPLVLFGFFIFYKKDYFHLKKVE